MKISFISHIITSAGVSLLVPLLVSLLVPLLVPLSVSLLVSLRTKDIGNRYREVMQERQDSSRLNIFSKTPMESLLLSPQSKSPFYFE